MPAGTTFRGVPDALFAPEDVCEEELVLFVVGTAEREVEGSGFNWDEIDKEIKFASGGMLIASELGSLE